MTELRIRVKDNIKEALEKIKDSNGISVNFQVNFAIYKYLVLDVKVPLWNLDDRPDPHYETINKLPEESNIYWTEKELHPKPYDDTEDFIEISVKKDSGIPTKNDQKSLVSPYYACGEPKNHKPRGDKC